MFLNQFFYQINCFSFYNHKNIKCFKANQSEIKIPATITSCQYSHFEDTKYYVTLPVLGRW